jgi:PAS domain S-box-containing protein
MHPPVPVPANESSRLDVLHSLDILDSEPEQSFDGLAECAARLLGCSAAFVTLIDVDRQWIKAGFGGPDRVDYPREITFCAHAVAQGALLEVPDARDDGRFANNPLVAGEPFVRFYAGEPLLVDGSAVGTLCVIDPKPRRLSEADRRSLQLLARAAAELLVNRRLLRRHQAEQQRLLDFARASGDWMWETDAHGRYQWISGAFEPITGLPPTSLIGEPIADAPLLNAEGLPAGGSLHELLARAQPFSRALTEKPTPRGRLVVSRSAVPVLDARGRLAGWRGTARDMTARIAAAAGHRARDELLHRLMAQAPGVMFQYQRQPDGRASFPFVSERIQELVGVAAAEVLADPGRAFGMIHEADLPAVLDAIAASERDLRPARYEQRVCLAAGQQRWLETRATPERLADGSTLWHGFITDVTERKETEEALRQSEQRWNLAAAAAGIGIGLLDLATQAVQFDAQANANHGLPHPQPHFTFNDWLAHIHPEDRGAAEAAVLRAVQQCSTLEARYRIRRADGTPRWLEFLAQVQCGDDGEPTHLIGTCRDVTEQLQAEQLRRDKLEAERASRAKTTFLSRVSHELRTPLNGILGFAQLMELDAEHPLAPVQRQRLSSVQRAGRHLLELINDVLDLTRIEREDFSLQAEPVALGTSLQGCLALVAPLAATRGIVLAPAPPTTLWVQADTRALEQVLMNLLSNAIKYNRDGGRVWVTVDSTARKVTIAVHDTGPGLTAEQRGRLFQPFARLGAEARRIEGSGLGLVIARQLVQAQGGTLDVEGEPGQGCVFRVVLPRCAPAAASAGPLDEAPPQGRREAAARQLVYIEDEPLNVVLMQELFRARPHWQLRVACDGRQGLAMARQHAVDLVLVDMNLPDMNGLQVLQRLRADPATAGLRCIALSADAMPEQVSRALAAGFDGYWTKPIDVQRLLQELDQLLA